MPPLGRNIGAPGPLTAARPARPNTFMGPNRLGGAQTSSRAGGASGGSVAAPSAALAARFAPVRSSKGVYRGDDDAWKQTAAGRLSDWDPGGGAPAAQPMPSMGGGGAVVGGGPAFGGDGAGGPSTAAPIMPPATTSTTAGAMMGLAGAMGEGGTGIRHGSFVPLRQGIGQRNPAPMEALLRGKMY